ncbi:MAG: hypothetical protein Q4F97_05450 [Bacteroidales bacterium]|nr:hypothetical protein [Bacteroidales bacterium]
MNKWVLQNHCLIPDVPFSSAEKISQEKASELMAMKNAILVRSIYNFDIKEPKEGWFIIKESFGGIDELSASTKSKTRRGLKKCIVKLTNTYTKDEKQTDIWEVFLKENEEKIGYSINRIAENEVFYETFRISKKYLKGNYPYYALIYSMNEYYLSKKDYKFVCDGFRTMRERSDIQKFLIDKFKFRKAYCNTMIYYNSSLSKMAKYLYAIRFFFPGERAKAFFRQHRLFSNSKD